MHKQPVSISRANAWSSAQVTVRFGKHVAKATCKSEEAIRRFIGKEMKAVMEKFISARGHAYAHTGRDTNARLEKIQLLRYRLSAKAIWDARKSAEVFLRSAGEFQLLMPPMNSRLRKSAEELFNDLTTYSHQILSQP